jgi:hypothetical protein
VNTRTACPAGHPVIWVAGEGHYTHLIPADAGDCYLIITEAAALDPVCGVCERPAEWNGISWQHARPADTVLCSIIYGTTLIVSD